MMFPGGGKYKKPLDMGDNHVLELSIAAALRPWKHIGATRL
jgi:hypothetical protein